MNCKTRLYLQCFRTTTSSIITSMFKKTSFVSLLLLFFVTISSVTYLHLTIYQSKKIRIDQSIQQILNKSQLSSDRIRPYFWCINHYGPNNQLKDFFKCTILAMMFNYTLIIPPLYPHYNDRIRGIQWFEHFYDLDQLSSAVQFVTLEEFFKEKRIENNKVPIDCYLRQTDLVKGRTWYVHNTLNSVQRAFRIQIQFKQTVDLSRHLNYQELFDKSRMCSSIFLHIHYTTFHQFFLSPNNALQKIFEHFHRNSLIQRMTSQLIRSIPTFLPRNLSLTTLAVIHIRLGDFNVMSLSMYIRNILHLIKTGVRFTHLHVMCPNLNPSQLKELKDNLPIPFTTSQQILSQVRSIFDEYLFDIFEQEIALQAPIFIASPWTTYSATIIMQKVYQDKGIVYVLSRNGRGKPLLVTKKNVKYF